MDKQTIICKHCKANFHKDDLQRSCCNCFCCTGCEIYVCDNCKQEIIVQPMGQAPVYFKDKPTPPNGNDPNNS